MAGARIIRISPATRGRPPIRVGPNEPPVRIVIRPPAKPEAA